MGMKTTSSRPGICQLWTRVLLNNETAVAPANASDVVKAEGVNYLRRVLSAFGSFWGRGGKGPRWVIYASEALAGPGMRQIFCIFFFTVQPLWRQHHLKVMVTESIRCSPTIYDLSIFLLSGCNHLITGLGGTALCEANTWKQDHAFYRKQRVGIWL